MKMYSIRGQGTVRDNVTIAKGSNISNGDKNNRLRHPRPEKASNISTDSPQGQTRQRVATHG